MITILKKKAFRFKGLEKVKVIKYTTSEKIFTDIYEVKLIWNHIVCEYMISISRVVIEKNKRLGTTDKYGIRPLALEEYDFPHNLWTTNKRDALLMYSDIVDSLGYLIETF